MLTMKLPKESRRLPGALSALLGALLLSIFVALPAMAADPSNPRLPMEERGQMRRVQEPRQVLNDDLTVESGQVIEDDVVVFSGNVDVDEGGRITGDLFVGSGNIEIDEDATVEGDVTNTSGNVKVKGYIGGDLTLMSGNVELASTAVVDGDISVVSGSIEREDGATVGGNVVQGPSFRFPGAAPEAPRSPAGVSFSDEGPSFFSRIISFVGRLFMAALMTAFVMLLVGGLFYLRPQLIADTRKQLKEQLALSAVVGVLANLTVLFLAGLLAITICLLPLALVPMLLLLAVNVVGWAVASQIVGERIVTVAKQEVQPALTILVGALFLTGICAVLWAFGGCFRPLAFILVLAASSLGTGAALLPWINRRRGGGGWGKNGGNNVPPSGPVSGGPASSTGSTEYGAPSASAVVERETVEHDIAAPIDYFTAEEINAAAEQTSVDAGASVGLGGVAVVTPSGSTQSSDPIEQDVAGPIDYVTAQEVNTTEAVSGKGDDFLRIKGIGPTYARRLKDAGYATFAQVAAASPEDVASAIGWPVDRVRRAEVIDQAKVLAQ